MTSLPITERMRGIHAATIVPLAQDLSIDEVALAEHLGVVSRVDGIAGLLINGHAGENFLLDRDEKRRVVEIARATVREDCVLVAGVNAEATRDAARHARDAELAGADAILLFPPNSWALSQETSAVLLHHRHVEEATELPILLYQAPVGAGAMGYSLATIEALIASPRVIGIKEGSWEVAAYEEHRRLVKAKRPDIAVLGSGDEHLLASYLVGSEGSQVSLAAIVPELVVELWRTASAGDWSAARAVHDRLYPLAVAIYRRAPSSRATARLKTCLRLLGRIASDATRPPMVTTPHEDIQALAEALEFAIGTRGIYSSLHRFPHMARGEIRRSTSDRS